MDFKYSATAKLEEGMRVRVQAGDHDANGLAKLEKFVEDQCAIGTLLKQENEVKTTFNLRSKS